jgi:tetratricopeptide (TPR) repeat protein
MPARRFTLAITLLAAPASFAQIQIDDRPKPLDDDKSITKDELNRRKAEQIVRDARARFGLGILSQRQEKLLEAVTTFEKAAKLDPDSLEIRRALIPLYVVIGRDEEALKLAHEVIDRDPFDLETAFQCARLLRADGKAGEAITVLQKAANGKDAQERPERLLILLSDLVDLLEKKGDFVGAAKTQDGIVRTITEKREQLLYGNGFTREDLQASLARAYEGLGRACVKTKEYERAVAAFRGARDSLLKSDDPDARHQAVRISLNVSEVAASQGRWAEALEALDAYLEHSPAELTPYETKIELLRKLGREREIVPALRKYAAKEEFHLGLQLLLARELAKDVRARREAEEMYSTLLKTNVKPEVYRGLFQLYAAEGHVEKALDHLDRSAALLAANEGDARPTEREAAQQRLQAMVAALRSDRSLVATLLDDVQAEVTRPRRRELRTWQLLAALAAHSQQLQKAEDCYRRCLDHPPEEREFDVYRGLLGVLQRQRKYDEIVKVCRQGLARRPARPGLEFLFLPTLASALAALGNYDEALENVENAIRIGAEEYKVDLLCKKAEILALAGRFDGAVRVCEETLANKDFNRTALILETRITLSNVYSQKGDHAKSEEQLRLVLEMDPDVPLASNNLGYQMADRNVNLDEAERLIRRAIDLDRSARKQVDEEGENAAYLDSLGWVLFRKGKLPEAREWLEKAAALPDGVDDPAVWDHLGDVQIKLDQPAKAKEAWQKAVKLYYTGGPRKSDSRKTEIEKKLSTVK